MLLFSMTRFFKFQPEEQRLAFLGGLSKKASPPADAGRPSRRKVCSRRPRKKKRRSAIANLLPTFGPLARQKRRR
jgi:hypothetical protein